MINRNAMRLGIGIILFGVASVLTLADAPATQKSSPASDAFDVVRGLAGTWVSSTPGKDGKPLTLVFKATSMDSAVMETMFPGTAHEMVNMYTIDGDNLVVTHYCAMGNQPHMRMTSMADGVLKFEFVSGGNMTSRDEMHMDSLQITVKGDALSEKWESYQDGKAGKGETFEFKRQS